MSREEVEKIKTLHMEIGIASNLATLSANRNQRAVIIRALHRYKYERRLVLEEGASLDERKFERWVTQIVLSDSSLALAAFETGVCIKGGADVPPFKVWLEVRMHARGRYMYGADIYAGQIHIHGGADIYACVCVCTP